MEREDPAYIVSLTESWSAKNVFPLTENELPTRLLVSELKVLPEVTLLETESDPSTGNCALGAIETAEHRTDGPVTVNELPNEEIPLMLVLLPHANEDCTDVDFPILKQELTERELPNSTKLRQETVDPEFKSP